MDLSRLLEVLPQRVDGETWAGVEVTSLAHDSRGVGPGCLFFAIAGNVVDGRDYIDDAIAKGAVGVIADNGHYSFPDLPSSYPLITVKSARLAEALICEKYFGASAKLDFRIGITGTNGKTSIAWLCSHALAGELGHASFVGTLGMSLFDRAGQIVLSAPCNTTTPDPVGRNEFLRSSLALGNRAMAMEVSSHALDQDRAAGIDWDVAVFTNLSRDHLDYHETFERYGEAKDKLFFRELQNSATQHRVACINVTDAFGQSIVKRLKAQCPDTKIIDYGTNADSLRIADARFSMHGTRVVLRYQEQEIPIQSPLVGAFNSENIAAAAAALIGCSVPVERISELIGNTPCVPGRLERVGKGDFGVFVDYAHTPDALQKAQMALRELCEGRLITVFGCGGDRDRGKRPEMGREVATLSDIAIVTTDNPRTEDPKQIIDDILPGLKNAKIEASYIEVDRRAAIERAIKMANSGDIVLIAGKGHEDYQDIQGVKHHFSDVEECLAVLE